MAKKPQVLFLCTGNSARSQMAEAFLHKYAGDRFSVRSAGLEPKGIHPLTMKALEEVGISLEGHRSKSLREFMGHSHSSYVITVCGHADRNCPHGLWSTGIKLYWPFEDPAAAKGTEEEKLEVFRQVRNQIEERVKDWLVELEQPAGESVRSRPGPR